MSRLALIAVLLAVSQPVHAQVPAEDPVAFRLDPSEAEAVLHILDLSAAHQPITAADWQQLFATEPYRRLKQRETSMGRQMTDDDFRTFVTSAELLGQRGVLRQTLVAWLRADLHRSAARILPYLPAGTRIRATVYPVIKPRTNSFVFETSSNPAIFLYLDPKMSDSAFENTVAHESHHIGLANATKAYDEAYQRASGDRKTVLKWVGAFGEGLAVLAAAGGPGRHPMTDFGTDDRIRWDQDMRFFNESFAQVDQFFRDVLRGGFKDEPASDHVGFLFFGYRGPWYTVGYRMGVVVEQQLGRERLLEGMTDPRKLLLYYNDAAEKLNKQAAFKDRLPAWSDEVIAAIR